MKIFDAHFHIIDQNFPLIPNQGYLPEHFDSRDYLSAVSELNVAGGAVVSGSFQGFDQSYLRHALEELGPAYVGVAQVPLSVSDEELMDLDQCGVRAVRFNLKRGCVDSLLDIASLASRAYKMLGWHSEFYVDAASLEEISDTLLELPAVVIDHLGLESGARAALLKLVEHGAHVKATGFGRLDFDPVALMHEINAINPASLVFGSDLPSTRAPVPFSPHDLRRVQDSFDADALQRMLWQNAVELYRPRNVDY